MRTRGGRVGRTRASRMRAATGFPADHPCHVTLRVRPGLPTLRDPDVVREIEAAFAIAYVLLNARKHAQQPIRRLRKSGMRNVAPLRNDGTIDSASSGRWFAGWRAARIRSDGSQPAVALPRTWLLRAGWRMHGLIDPNAIPVHA